MLNKTGSKQRKNLVVKGNYKHFVYTPRQKGPSLLRIVPMLDEAGNEVPQVTPGALTEEDICDGFLKIDYAQFLGTNSIHLMSPAVNGKTSVINVFYEAISNYAESYPRSVPGAWLNWLGKKDEGQTKAPRACLRPAREYMFFQCLLYMNEGKYLNDKTKEPLFPVIFAISPVAHRDMIKKMLTPKDPNAPVSVENSVLGDVMSSKEGRCLQVIPYDREIPELNNTQTWYRVEAATKLPLTMDIVRKVWVPWERLVNMGEDAIPFVMEKLAETFTPEAVSFSFYNNATYGDYLPAGLRKKYDPAATTVRVTEAIPKPAVPNQPQVAVTPPEPGPVPENIGEPEEFSPVPEPSLEVNLPGFDVPAPDEAVLEANPAAKEHMSIKKQLESIK